VYIDFMMSITISVLVPTYMAYNTCHIRSNRDWSTRNTFCRLYRLFRLTVLFYLRVCVFYFLVVSIIRIILWRGYSCTMYLFFYPAFLSLVIVLMSPLYYVIYLNHGLSTVLLTLVFSQHEWI